jgi:class 3 adenylate cyclase
MRRSVRYAVPAPAEGSVTRTGRDLDRGRLARKLDDVFDDRRDNRRCFGQRVVTPLLGFWERGDRRRGRLAVSERAKRSLTAEWPAPERRLAAIFAADIAGYSRAMHADESGAMRALQATRAIVDHLIAARRGRIANTAGDSVLAEFVSVADAVQCAAAIQRMLAQA